MITNLDKIWQEIIEEEKKSVVPSKEEGEMTVYDFMEQTGFTRDQAAKRLNKLVRDGTLTKRSKVYIQQLGGIYTLYKPVVKD